MILQLFNLQLRPCFICQISQGNHSEFLALMPYRNYELCCLIIHFPPFLLKIFPFFVIVQKTNIDKSFSEFLTSFKETALENSYLLRQLNPFLVEICNHLSKYDTFKSIFEQNCSLKFSVNFCRNFLHTFVHQAKFQCLRT